LIRFILNNETIAVDLPPGTILLDFIRYHKNLTGTKIGCREGDCGACTIMVGKSHSDEVQYSTATSCLMPLGNAQGKHIVTIEGINQASGLTPVQEAFAKEGATQCGFCTPGFIMSLTNFCLQPGNTHKKAAIDAMNGNICRCTGYKSIERAGASICELMQGQDSAKQRLSAAIDQHIVNDYFSEIPARLMALQADKIDKKQSTSTYLGGGTDLYVQQHDTMPHQSIEFLLDDSRLRKIEQQDDSCFVGGAATVTDLAESPVFRSAFPALDAYIKLISSTPIRNMATIAGNIANASPIGDLTAFFLALDANLRLETTNSSRKLPLRQFYKGYKKMDLENGEIIAGLSFPLPRGGQCFNFEKVCKRSWLDIASVNTAILVETEGSKISAAHISAGGVAPIPLYLEKSSKYLVGKEINDDLLHGLQEIVQAEISPISDVRGSEKYKRLLLRQLIRAHFIKLFPAQSFTS
jgi:xanthine dehydrogenase small subunit